MNRLIAMACVAAACGGAGRSLKDEQGAAKCASAEACGKLCDAGRARACTALAGRYASGDGVTADPARSEALYQKACDLGDGDGCQGLGGIVEPRDAKRAQELYALAAKRYDHACDAGDGAACSSLGLMIENTRGVPQDDKRMIALYRRACDLKDGDGCYFLGSAYDDGRGVPHDPKLAEAAYERGCDVGDGDGCEAAAAYFEDLGALPCDLPRAATLHRRASDAYEHVCSDGDDFGCWQAALIWESGGSLPADKDRELAILGRGCGANGGDSCDKLASLVEEDGDSKRATELYRKACDLGEDDSCVGAWRLLTAANRGDEAKGYGDRVLKKRTADCAKGNGHTCDVLSKMYHDGTVVSADAAKAAEYRGQALAAYQAGCKPSNRWACHLVAQAYLKGDGVPLDAAKAAKIYADVCDAGHSFFCDQAGDAYLAADKASGGTGGRAEALRLYRTACEHGGTRSCQKYLATSGKPDPAISKLAEQSEAEQHYCSGDEDEGSDEDYDDGDDDASHGDPCDPGEDPAPGD